MKLALKPSQGGFTLIEILIATSMVTLVMVSISSGVSFAVKNARFSQEKSRSIRYAQESIEWYRAVRDGLGWGAFYQVMQASGSTRFTYCLGVLPANPEEFGVLQPRSLGSNCTAIPQTKYVRRLNVTITDSSTIEVESKVTWSDGQQQHETSLTTTLREW